MNRNDDISIIIGSRGNLKCKSQNKPIVAVVEEHNKTQSDKLSFILDILFIVASHRILCPVTFDQTECKVWPSLCLSLTRLLLVFFTLCNSVVNRKQQNRKKKKACISFRIVSTNRLWMNRFMWFCLFVNGAVFITRPWFAYSMTLAVVIFFCLFSYCFWAVLLIFALLNSGRTKRLAHETMNCKFARSCHRQPINSSLSFDIIPELLEKSNNWARCANKTR